MQNQFNNVTGLSLLARDLDHAIEVINALSHCARERKIVPPQSLLDATGKAVETLSAWRDEIRKRSLH